MSHFNNDSSAVEATLHMPPLLPLDLQVTAVSQVAPQRSLESFHHCTLHADAKNEASCFQHTQAQEMGASPSLCSPSCAFICHIHTLSVLFPVHSDAVLSDTSPKRIPQCRFCVLRHHYSCLLHAYT
ncbi:hypothetical protein BV22DRAFT_938215 [Leucogyrophana mollusca]|uniref:Uncharacterized protein n=1 Tax=Leucogyrophana mollusca TaxID=85980 RepID=A0ACB8AXR4_9AGAM|nr:hypothetical protein BV22DRAFT_938215 [Leucogyrophana mollusca]